MTLKEIFQVAWKNKGKIAEGFYNVYVSQNKEIQAEILRRKAICESNVCGYYDAKGETEKVLLPGKPACSLCGCNIPAKPACMHCSCTLAEIGETPLWEGIMEQAQEDEIRQIAADKREKYLEHQRNKKQQ